jgi:hypothetical protein
MKKVFTKNWASPTRIITTKSYKFETKDIYNVLEVAILSWLGYLLLNLLMRGY